MLETTTKMFWNGLPLDSNNAGLGEEGDFEEYQEEDQGQVADQGKPSNLTHASVLLLSNACFQVFYANA